MNAAVGTRFADLPGDRTNASDSTGYRGKIRVVEPHDHGILNGSVQLLAYQTAGSSSRALPNWILMKANEITDLTLLEETFPGGRRTSGGNHIHRSSFG